MKKRYLYLVLFGIPGLIVSSIFAGLIFLFSMGVSWLFIFGDDTWPSNIFIVFSLLSAITFLVSWISILIYGFKFGKNKELTGESVGFKHIVTSFGIAIILILIIAIRFYSGIKYDEISSRCINTCTELGYDGSSLDPIQVSGAKCGCHKIKGDVWIKAY